MNENDESIISQNVNFIQDEAMIRANQTFDKIKEEVKSLIDENEKASKTE